MAYRNKTFVSFASEDLNSYWLMTAWKKNKNIDFDFYDAHDLNTARDTSHPDTIKRRLRERLANAKQIILLVSDVTRSKAARSNSFIHYEIDVIKTLDLPIVFANINQSRKSDSLRIPAALGSPSYTISTSFQPLIIKYALDKFPADYAKNKLATGTNKKVGPYHYKESVYQSLGI
jgi:hypothetical protein